MQSYEVTRSINASPESIWAVLTDANGYTAWDSGVERVEGEIAPGARIKVYAKISPGRAFPVRVALDPPTRMTWTGGMPFGLFKGVRSFTLTQEGDATRFDMREEFTGPLLSMIWKTMPNLTPSFEQFADGLREKAEQTG